MCFSKDYSHPLFIHAISYYVESKLYCMEPSIVPSGVERVRAHPF